jgi:hypothetical protein
MLMGAHWSLSAAKDLASKLIGRGRARQQLKKAIRVYGRPA